MMLQKARRKGSFSLIEILVVIAIIAILMSLLMAAVQRAREAGRRTDNGQRMQQISQAVGLCKEGLKLAYIPSHPLSNGGFTLKVQYNQNDPELEFLTRAFPNINWQSNTGLLPALNNTTLDANQTLVFWLCGVGDQAGTAATGFGFSNNPAQPLAPARPGEQRKGPYLKDGSRYLSQGSGFPRFIDAYGNPVAYFAPVGGKPGMYGTQTYTVNATTVSPYQVQGGGRFVAQDGFQIISAGRNGRLGAGGATNPAIGDGEDDMINTQTEQAGAGVK